MTTTMKTLAALQREHDRIEAAKLRELQKRFVKLQTLRKNIDTELLVLTDEIENIGSTPAARRRSRYDVPECGTESGYHRHRRLGESCEECKQAHRDHERVAAARRKLRRLAERSKGGK